MPEKPAAVEADTLAWRKEADLVLAYIDDRLIFEQGHVIPAADLSADFSTWMEQRGQRAWADRTFVQRMKDHEVVTGARVEYDRARQGGQCKISRSPDAFIGGKPVGDRFRAWIGMRFATEDEAGTAGTPSSGEPLVSRDPRGNQTFASQASQSDDEPPV